jgi:hypothetical protein
MGDAIQCATLRAAAAMQCKQQEAEDAMKASSEKALGDSILKGQDPMQGAIDGALKGTSIDMSSAKLDQAGFLGGGACIAPKTVSFLGHSMVMDFARACEAAQPVRYAVLAISFIIAYLIVSRSVLNS